MEWIRLGECSITDGTLALCAFWGAYGPGYTFALGRWFAEKDDFTFHVGIQPKGELIYYAPVRYPADPVVNQWEQWKLLAIEAQLENILALLRGQK